MGNTSVYVVAVMGQTPAVITELLWWLVTQEKHDVVGLEIWTTASDDEDRPSGVRSLRRALKSGLWETLEEAVGPDAIRLPPKPDKQFVFPQNIPSVSELSPENRRSVVVRLEHEGEMLPDIRDDEEADAQAAHLYERIRTLRDELPQTVVMYGSLAGGRKTMSSALQTAFELQGRPKDHLVHVLTHAKIEENRDLHFQFQVPNTAIKAELGLELDEQVTVYEVPFPLLRELLKPDKYGSDDLAKLFTEEPYEEVLGRLRRNVLPAGTRTARLVDGDAPYYPFRLEVLLDGVVQEASANLSSGNAETLAALVKLGPEGGSMQALYERLRRGGVTKPGSDKALDEWNDDLECSYIRKRISRLRKALRDPLFFYEEFIPRNRDGQYVIPAAEHLDVRVGILR